MKALFYFTFLLGISNLQAIAAPIFDGPVPWPPGTVLYHASAATLTYVSPKYFDMEMSEDRITVKLNGEWQFNPKLRGAHVSPQAGIDIGADNPDRKRKLEELRSLCASLEGRRVDVYIYAGAVNKDQVTYAWPEQIKIIPYKGAAARWH